MMLLWNYKGGACTILKPTLFVSQEASTYTYRAKSYVLHERWQYVFHVKVLMEMLQVLS